MATLTLRTNCTAAVSINGSFLGFIEENTHLTLPLPASDTYFAAISCEESHNPLNYFLSFKNGAHLLPCSGRLCRWNDDIYELFFVFDKTTPPPPPVILKQEQWGSSIVGLCGGYFIKEDNNGCKYFPEIIDNYTLATEYAILTKGRTVIILDKSLNEILRRECCTYIKDSDKIILRFTPGEMDFFTVEQIFYKTIISSKIIQQECQTHFDRLRCFCQAVRLNTDFSSFLTPSLKSAMTEANIKDFLGVFDCTDTCRYIPNADNNAVALRYMVDSSNYHYICYRFTTDTSGLIDDISEL